MYCARFIMYLSDKYANIFATYSFAIQLVPNVTCCNQMYFTIPSKLHGCVFIVI